MTDPVAEHDARYGEEGAGPPDWAPVRDRWRVAGRLVHDDAELIGQVNLAHRSRFTNPLLDGSSPDRGRLYR